MIGYIKRVGVISVVALALTLAFTSLPVFGGIFAVAEPAFDWTGTTYVQFDSNQNMWVTVNQAICVDEDITFKAVVEDFDTLDDPWFELDPIVEYIWKVDDTVVLQGATATQYLFRPTAPGLYSVSVTAKNGEQTLRILEEETLTWTVAVQGGTVTSIKGALAVKANTPASFEVVTNPTAAAPNTAWSAPTGNPISGTGATFQTTWSTLGSHTITADGGCSVATRQVEVCDCDTGSICYVYDACGNRIATFDDSGMSKYEYDVLGQVTKVTYPDGRWVSYEYDGKGNRTKMTTHSDSPAFEHVTQYSYYNNGLLHQVTDQLGGVTTYTYKPNGLTDTITYPNNTKAVHNYNDRGWLTSISNQKSDGTIIAQFDYEYNETSWGKNGTRTKVTETILKPDKNPGDPDAYITAQVEYKYDDLYRLTQEHRTGTDPGVAYEYNYAYDAAGNRTSKEIVGGATTSYTYDAANKMLTAGTSTFTYDDKGNILTETNGTTVTTYTWNYLNQMTKWERTGATTEEYVYNADGMRVKEMLFGATTTEFLADKTEILVEITGNEVASYIGKGLGKIQNGALAIYHLDGSASVRSTSDASQSVQVTHINDAYGNMIKNYPDFAHGRFTFAGQYAYQSDNTGLYYLFTRYYDAVSGRFLSRDLIGFNGGLNLYAYVGSNPANYVDPNGTLRVPSMPNIIIVPPTIDPIRLPNPLNPMPPVGTWACCIYYDDCINGIRMACLAYAACKKAGDGPWADCVRAQLRSDWLRVRGDWRKEAGWIIDHARYYATCTVREIPWFRINPPRLIFAN